MRLAPVFLLLSLLATGCSRAQPDPLFARMAGISPPPAGAHVVHQASGFFIGGDGLLLTAAHVTKSCKRIDIASWTDTTQGAALLAADAAADVAVLRVPGPLRPVLPVARIAPSDARLLVLAYPDDAVGSRARRIPAVAVNAIARGFNANAPRSSEGLIMRATIRHGDSGGPVLNEAGQVVGLVQGVLDRPDEVQKFYGFRADDVAVGPGLGPILRLIGGMPAAPGAEGTPEQAVARVICWE